MKRLLLGVLLAGLAAYALGPQWQSLERMGERRFRALEHRPKEILIGVCWPFAVNQDGMQDGLLLAQEEINQRSLPHNIPFRLVLRDDAFSEDQARSIAMEFANTETMSAVVGYYDDSQAIRASPLYEASRLLHLIVGANNTSLTGHGRTYVVRTIISSEKIARSLARMTADRGHQRIAVIWEADAYGEDLAYQYRLALDTLEPELVYQRSYFRDRADFRLPVNELKAVDADAIFFAGLEPLAGDFLRMARQVGLKADVIGAFSDTPEMREHAGSALEGAFYYTEYNVDSPSPENQAFVAKFRARYGRAPDTWAAQGYDALQILVRAVDATGSANPLDLAYAIRFMDAWQGANGRYKFDAQGELEDKPIFLNVYRNGRPVIIQTSDPLVVPPP